MPEIEAVLVVGQLRLQEHEMAMLALILQIKTNEHELASCEAFAPSGTFSDDT
jgi:hypothetical protein